MCKYKYLIRFIIYWYLNDFHQMISSEFGFVRRSGNTTNGNYRVCCRSIFSRVPMIRSCDSEFHLALSNTYVHWEDVVCKKFFWGKKILKKFVELWRLKKRWFFLWICDFLWNNLVFFWKWRIVWIYFGQVRQQCLRVSLLGFYYLLRLTLII